MDWKTLFSIAISQWQEFLEVLVGRAPEDPRLKSLIEFMDL